MSDGELKEEQIGELTVPLKSRPTRYALAKFLGSVELPPSVSVSNLISRDQYEASSFSSDSDFEDDALDDWPKQIGPMQPVKAVQSMDNGVRGQLFNLRETLLQLLEFILPPPNNDDRHAVHAHFDEYWRWSSNAPPDEAPLSEEEMQDLDPFRFESQAAVSADPLKEIVVLLAGDGFPITESPRRSLTLLRFGLGNLRILQQSCDAWPLLGIIDEAESHAVVRSFTY